MIVNASVAKVFENCVEVSGTKKVKYVALDKIKLNQRPITWHDIEEKDSLKLDFDRKNNLIAARLIKQSSGPKPPPQSDIPTQSEVISELTSISDLDLATENSKAISSIFELCRKIRSGPSNMGLAILVSIIDYSITYKITEILTKMHSLLREYYHERIPESQNDFKLLENILVVINSNNLIKAKLKEVQKFYNAYHDDFNLLIRNCLQILVKLKYFTEEYADRRDLNPRPELLNRIINSLGSPQIEDFTFFLNYFDISLRIVDGERLNIFSLSGARHPAYLLQKNDGYYPLYTIEDAYLQKASQQDYESAMTYLMQNINIDLREFEIELNNKNQELEETTEQNKKLAKVFLKINGSINPSREVNIAAQNTGGAFSTDEIKEILEEKCCNQCFALVDLVRFDCNHGFCQNCVYSTENPQFKACYICGFFTDFGKICQRYREVEQV